MPKHTILRRTVDPSGNVGSLYDGCRDSVLEQLTVIREGKTLLWNESIRCELIDINRENSGNLLLIIGIDDGLRLSILLKLASRIGTAALIDHSRPIDKYTRILYIFYADREQRLPEDPEEARKYVDSSVCNSNATHVITAVSFGIDIAVVLQLPDKENTVREIDVALKKIRDRLNKSDDFSSFTTNGESVLRKIRETRAYSNIFELTEMTSLTDICHYITRLKRKSNTYCPLAYTLQPIEWLHPDAHESRASYIPLEKNDSDKLEQYLIDISNQMRRVNYFLDSDTSKSLPDHRKEMLQKAQNERKNVQQAYKDAIKRLKRLVYGIRSGHNDASEIDETLKHKNQTILKEDIRELYQQVHNLEAEMRLINSSIEQHNQTLSSNVKVTDNNQSTLSIVQSKEKNQKAESLHPSASETQTSATTMSSSNNEILNVLLLGESGVGKSTFVNAFVNYLKFRTLEEAESGTPAVLVPVSFVITTGNNFEEQTVKFGDSDNFNNEDFDHPGQSVTQHCKSYVFNLNHTNGKKLRIIDTPGFGDTRGLDQDDLNMQHILEYINNLTHLNAVCFLLRPNTSQINNFFQTCLTQLLDLLGPHARQNIIFCFTNARSTFYSPGDTAPLLKKILKSLPMDDIPFTKENTFCFDNESFRYLVALQNSVTFDDHDKEEYEMSWLKSVNESKRLRNYIRKNLTVCPMRNEQQSIKHAQIEIGHMIRPMLEAMRNILRNIIICEMDSSNNSIELVPKALYRPAAFCFTCDLDPIQKGKFWIARDIPHEIQKNCHSCECISSQHIPIDYILQYKYSDKPLSCNRDDMEDNLAQLLRASSQFAYFLTCDVHSSKDDPFWIGITRMIREENYIYKFSNSNEMNLKLFKDLKDLLGSYEQRIDSAKSDKKPSKLSVIFKLIETVCEYPIVEIQMAAVRETQNEMMKLYEYEVPHNL